MQVILTEEEYNKLKMEAKGSKNVDHIALQNCTIGTLDGFLQFVKQTLAINHFAMGGLDPVEDISNLVSDYKKELQSHFVR